mmetsp:Transcript_34595/g.58105  ORF Transcript_34595/g.58105 Transcript_34595/m.58105 type:complete len:203 (-) Transcript_34595:92-700(-)
MLQRVASTPIAAFSSLHCARSKRFVRLPLVQKIQKAVGLVTNIDRTAYAAKNSTPPSLTTCEHPSQPVSPQPVNQKLNGATPSAQKPLRKNAKANRSTNAGLSAWTSGLCATSSLLCVSSPALAVAGDGSNPLEGLLGGESPIPFFDGSVTGYWFLDVFVVMNLILVFGLLVFTMFKPSSLKEPSEAKIFSEKYNDNDSRNK